MRRLPLAAAGVALIMGSLAPALLAMVRAFQNASAGASQDSIDQRLLDLAFHPWAVAAGALGGTFIVAAMVWAMGVRARM